MLNRFNNLAWVSFKKQFFILCENGNFKLSLMISNQAWRQLPKIRTGSFINWLQLDYAFQSNQTLVSESRKKYTHTGWDKSGFTVAHMESNTTLINNNTRINSVFHVLRTVKLLLPHAGSIAASSFSWIISWCSAGFQYFSYKYSFRITQSLMLSELSPPRRQGGERESWGQSPILPFFPIHNEVYDWGYQ